jgi:hypothetical protein
MINLQTQTCFRLQVPGLNRIIPLLLFCLAFSFPLKSQDVGAGLDFLNISPSTSLLGISEAQTAFPAGAASIYSNPALLVFSESSVLDLSYTLWIAEVQNQYAAVNFRRGNSSFALGVYNSSSDEFEARDQPGEPAGVFSIGYLSISGAGAYRFGPVAVGLTGQYLREEVFQYRANGYAISIGAAASLFNDRVRTGIAILNIGEMQDLNNEATLLPTTIRFGIDTQFIEFTTPGLNDLPILLSVHADYMQPLEESPSSDFIDSDRKEPFYNFGITADIAHIFQLRSGFKLGPTERPFSIGAGFLIDPVKINYALVPFSTGYGTVHSIGLEYYF